MAGVGTSKGVAKVKSTVETDQEGQPTVTSLTEYSEFKKAIAKSPALVSGYSKLLKSAGYYRGPVTTKYTPALQKALDRAEEDRLSISAIRPIGRDEFLNEQINFGGAGGDGKARTTSQTYIANDSDIEALANKIYQDATGYGATPKQIAEAKKVLRRELRENPVVQSYDAAGNLVQSGGINAEQILAEEVAQTGAAEKTRAERANQIMLRELGGLQ
jgi:hypothetical protein